MNTKFVVRSFIVLLAVTAILLTAISFLPPSILLRLVMLWATRPPNPTPPPPTVLAPPGELPTGLGGLLELAQTRGGPFIPMGSGFLLRLSDGRQSQEQEYDRFAQHRHGSRPPWTYRRNNQRKSI